MTRFGIDTPLAIRLAEAGRGAPDGSVAPAVLGADALRILGDTVSMREARGVAAELGLDAPGPSASFDVPLP